MSDAARHLVCPSCRAVNRVPVDRPAREAKCGNCHQPLFSDKPAPADAEAFDRHISRDDIPVLVDFWAPWCGPCRMMAPALEHAAGELEPDYRVLKVNTEEASALASRYNIRSIPTLMLLVGGRPVARTAGAMDTQHIVSWVRSQSPVLWRKSLQKR